MNNSNNIYIIHAKDADQHLGKLKEILEDLKSENRIDSYTALKSNSLEEDSFKDLGTADMVILLLTHDLEPDRNSIEKALFDLRERQPDCKIAEVIVDNIPYEPRFIAFPPDLEPIRARENMDGAWNDTKKSLKDFFPTRVISEDDPNPTPWKKYLLIALGVIVLVALVIWAMGKFGGEPKADFSYRVLDPVRGDVFSNAKDCYVPCKVLFNNKSTDTKSLRWEFKDTTIIGNSEPEVVFLQPGISNLSLIAISGNKEDKITKTIALKAPPQASFEIENEGCVAPCDLTFNNTSKDASKFTWIFSGGNTENSNTKDPGKITYSNAGKFRVKLTAENSDGIKSDTVQEVTVQEDLSPFAGFNYKRLTNWNGPHKYNFTSTSKNATQLRWEIYKGANLLDVKTTPSFTYTFPESSTYSVKLLVSGAAGNDETFKNIKTKNFQFEGVYDKQILKDILKNRNFQLLPGGN